MHSRPTHNQSWSFRVARLADAARLEELAAPDSQRPPAGDVLVAEIDGELAAAVEVVTGRTIADPFSPSGEVAAALAFHAGHRPRRRPGHRRAHRLAAA
jgi:hypothetical protein